MSKGNITLFLPYTQIMSRPGRGWRNRGKTVWFDAAVMKGNDWRDNVIGNDGSRPHWKRLKRICVSLVGRNYTINYEFASDRIIARIEW